VGEALLRTSYWFPLVVLLEMTNLGFDLAALRVLYGPDRHRLTVGSLARAGLVGYAVMCLVPAGGAVAEATRAALLTSRTSAPRAFAAGTRLQALGFLANAALGLPCLVASAVYAGFGPLTWLLVLYVVGAGGLGVGMFWAMGRTEVGSWLGRRVHRMAHGGPVFDNHLRETPTVPWGAVVLTLCGRVAQLAQNAVLVVAAGGALGVRPTLLCEGLHLVGVALGELVPGQLGVQEAGYTWSATVLQLPRGNSVSIALVAHLAQLVIVLIGAAVALFWRSQRAPVAAADPGPPAPPAGVVPSAEP